ncbi:hypothetical protein C8R48DRAFT_781213 [Suillus tomentosus]|nr:hypothetical protein C8R48DRAFT_781213 [Suillus tomentosus]
MNCQTVQDRDALEDLTLRVPSSERYRNRFFHNILALSDRLDVGYSEENQVKHMLDGVSSVVNELSESPKEVLPLMLLTIGVAALEECFRNS